MICFKYSNKPFELPDVNIVHLVEILLDQKWQRDCKIITDYKIFPKNEEILSVVISTLSKCGTMFLRFSCGPQQGFFWDTCPDDFLSIELAIIALSKAPAP